MLHRHIHAHPGSGLENVRRDAFTQTRLMSAFRVSTGLHVEHRRPKAGAAVALALTVLLTKLVLSTTTTSPTVAVVLE